MLDPIEDQYLLIGRINRSHGVKGEVLIISDFYAPDLFDNIDLVHLQNSRGDLIPARVESVRVQDKQNRLSFFLKFEHVADRSEAEQLKNMPVFVNRQAAEPLIDDSDAPLDFTEFQVFDDLDQPIGEVKHTIDNPAHPILQVHTRNDEYMMVPFVDEYIVSVDEEHKTIRCHNLDQLEGL